MLLPQLVASPSLDLRLLLDLELWLLLPEGWLSHSALLRDPAGYFSTILDISKVSTLILFYRFLVLGIRVKQDVAEQSGEGEGLVVL